MHSTLRASAAHSVAAIALGDWNFTGDASDMLHTTDTGLHLPTAAADVFDIVFGDCRDLFQPLFTFSRRDGDEARRMFSRLDRA